MKTPDGRRRPMEGIPSVESHAGEAHSGWKRQFLFPVRLAVFLAVVMQGVEYWGWFAGTEGLVLDLLLAGRSAGNSAGARVILIEINDTAYASCFGGVSPMDPQRLWQIVSDLLAADVAPSVLGIDIITDSPLYHEKYVEISEDLRSLIDHNNLKTEVVWASGADVSNSPSRSMWRWFRGSEVELLSQPTGVLGTDSWDLRDLREKGPSIPRVWEWGSPVFPADEDFRLRRFPRTVSAIFVSQDGKTQIDRNLLTWARKIAEHSGIQRKLTAMERIIAYLFRTKEDDREVLLSYSIPFVEDYHLTSLYSCTKREDDGRIDIAQNPTTFAELKKKVKGEPDKSGNTPMRAIILLGGTFSGSGDFHETSQGRVSGLEINGRAVQAELAGPFIHEFPRYWMLLFDIVIGCVIGLIFAERRIIWGSLGMVIFGVLLICFALITAHVWLNWMGAAFCVLGCSSQWCAREGQRIRAVILGSLGMVIFAGLVSYVALSLGYWWVSCVGVAIGVNIHVLYEAYKMDAPEAE